MRIENTWDLRSRVVESARAILQREGARGYFVTVKPGVWSTYTRYDRRRIQFGERLLLHSNSRRGYAHDRNLRGQSFYRDPWGRLGALVLHECAHAVARQRHPRSRPHGAEFYRVEAELLQRYLPALSGHLKTGNWGEFIEASAERPGVHAGDECARDFNLPCLIAGRSRRRRRAQHTKTPRPSRPG